MSRWAQRQAVGEAPQETGRSDCARFAAGDVRQVGEIALEQVRVFLCDRHPPGTIVGALAGSREGLGKLGVGREQARVMRAEGDDAGAGQGRDVDDRARLEAARKGDAVAEDQPALGVGVQHFDGLARHRSDDVARLGRAAARHVLAGRDDPDHVDRRADRRKRLDRAEDATRRPTCRISSRPCPAAA